MASPPRIDSLSPATRFALIAGLVLALGACSTRSYPSLARRAGENLQMEEGKAPAAAADASAATPLATWLAKARAAQEGFAQALPRTQALLSKAGPRGGESWSQANLALADLERQRGALGEVVADMEQTYAQDRLDHGVQGPARPEWAKLRAEILNIAAEQDRQLADLRAKLL